jgi:hypothetical protein
MHRHARETLTVRDLRPPTVLARGFAIDADGQPLLATTRNAGWMDAGRGPHGKLSIRPSVITHVSGRRIASR